MPSPYSIDLRQRVLADYDEGAGPAALSRQYRVTERWIYKLLRQRRETGNIEPRRGQRGPKPKLGSHARRLRKLVKTRPDATLEELRDALGMKVCITTLWRALRDLKITLKKSPARRRTKAA